MTNRMKRATVWPVFYTLAVLSWVLPPARLPNLVLAELKLRTSRF